MRDPRILAGIIVCGYLAAMLTILILLGRAIDMLSGAT